MRAFDRDLIRGGHYGQRSCEPHLMAEHTGAPTNAASVKKVLANSEPSTHGGIASVQTCEPSQSLGPSRQFRIPKLCCYSPRAALRMTTAAAIRLSTSLFSSS